MKENINKKFSKDKNMKISEDLHKKLTEIKSQFHFSTFEDLLNYLINEKKSDIETYISMQSKEKTISKMEEEIYSRVDSIQKRLSKFGTLYFDKIIDIYNLHEQSTIEILKQVSKSGSVEKNISNTENGGNNKEVEKLKNENKALLEDSLRNDEILDKLQSKVRTIKSKFELKNSAFSKAYEAKLTVDEYEKIFQ